MNNTKKSLKASKGITLIALVITIIVLLILAGISISMLSGDNSRLQKATDAKTRTDEAQIKERIQLAYHSALTGGQGSYTKETLEEALENEFGESNYNVDDSDSDNWVLTGKVQGKEQSVSIPAGIKEKSSSTRASLTPAPVGATYNEGDEVAIGDEHFFVLSDTGTKLKLLAKFCLSKTENKQLTESAVTSDFGRSFSSTNYWSSDFTSNPFDLQGTYLENHPLTNVETDANNAIKKAQSYGESLGGTGRLMTYEEADTIHNGTDTLMQSILWGWYNYPYNNTNPFSWFLGSAFSTNNVYIIGNYTGMGGLKYYIRK